MLGKGQRESFRLRTEGAESGFSKEVLSRQRGMHRKGECTEGQRFYEWVVCTGERFSFCFVLEGLLLLLLFLFYFLLLF